MTARIAACIALSLALPVAGVQPAAGVADHPAGDVLVVDDDGGADYASVQAAVDAADPGDTVRVRPGTYRENVTVDVDLTLVAPRGATLDGSRFAGSPTGIDIRDNATVVVDGFTVTGYAVGVDAGYRSTADWVVRNTTISNVWIGVAATSTAGDWHLRNVNVLNVTGTGVDATYATGDWTVRDAVVRNLTEAVGVVATSTEGAWVLDDVTVADGELAGVVAAYSTGDWRIVNSTVRDTAVGVGALGASGDWVVRNSTIANASYKGLDMVQPPLAEGVGLHADGTTGSWTVRSTRFVGNEEGAVLASGADPAGDATRNWWGDAAGPDDDDCTGAVDCGDPLAEWPPESAPATPDATPPGSSTTTSASATPATPTTTTSPLPAAGAVAGLVAAALLVGRSRRSV